MFNITLEDGSNLVVSPEHRVYGAKEDSSLVSSVMMLESLELNGVSLDLEGKDKTPNLDPLTIAHISPEVFEVVNGGFITVDDLIYFLSNCKGEFSVFEGELVQPAFELGGEFEFETHFSPISLSRSSRVIVLPEGSFSASFNSLMNSSLTSISSSGSQPVLSQNSSSLADISSLMNLSNISLFIDSSLAISDQFTQEKCLITENNLSSSEMVILTTQITPFLSSSSNFSSRFAFLMMPCFITSAQFTSDLLSNLSFSSLGIDTVNLFIFDTSTRVDKRKCVNIYRDFELKNGVGSFSLEKITEVYQKLSENPELEYYFLDSENNPVKVLKIEKIPYAGKIYDVDVPNDIEADTLAISGNITISSQPVTINKRPVDAEYPFYGTIDEVRIYNRALTEDEIRVEYINGRAKHGMPDWNDPRYRQEFKLLQQFKRDYYPEITQTYLFTAHDPYIRVFTDTSQKSGELSCYDNETRILTREEISLEELMREIGKTQDPGQKTSSLVSFIVMPEENENNSFSWFINPEFEDEAFENVNSSFPGKVMPQWFVVMGVKNGFTDLVINNFPQDGIFPAGFVDFSLTAWNKSEAVTHFNELKNSSAELYLLPGVSSFNLLFNSSICSFLGCNSSTGCQSILSQNSQSSSEIVPVLIYLSNISFFNISSLAMEDQLTQEKCSIAALNLSGKDNVTLTIYISPLFTNSSNFHNCSSFLANLSFRKADQLISGCSSILFFNSSGIDTVNVAILLPLQDSVNTQNSVDIYSDSYLNKLPSCSEIQSGMWPSQRLGPEFAKRQIGPNEPIGSFGHVSDSEGISHICQEEGKFYSQEWKFFKDLNKNEKVATLNTQDPRPEDRRPKTEDWNGTSQQHIRFIRMMVKCSRLP